MPNRFEEGRTAFEQGIAALGEAAKRDPRLTPIVASAMRVLHGTDGEIPMPRRPDDVERVTDLPLPGGNVPVSGA